MITGAARRIGRAIALDMAQAGWDVILHYHGSGEAAASLAREIEALDGFAALVELDLANAGAVAKIIPSLTAELGPIAALVNNAGLFEPDTQDPDGSRHRAVNYIAPCLLGEAFVAARDPAAEVPPVIINLLDADPTTAGFDGYNRSKRELAAWTVDLAARAAPFVRVNGVALGPVLPGARETPEHHAGLIAATPLKRPIPAAEVAAVTRMLIEAPAITGVILPVDGGGHLMRRALR